VFRSFEEQELVKRVDEPAAFHIVVVHQRGQCCSSYGDGIGDLLTLGERKIVHQRNVHAIS
jgi:hypothetical protein